MQAIEALPPAQSPFQGLPPSPPFRPNPLKQGEGAPSKEGAYFPMVSEQNIIKHE